MSQKYVVCEKCERVFELSVDGIYIEGRSYTCDHCRMSAGNPRVMQPQHVQIIQPWQPTSDQPCAECGEDTWFVIMKMMVAREFESEGGIFIKGAIGDPLQYFDCPNPNCTRSWVTPTSTNAVPPFLRPPWDRPKPGLSATFDAMTDGQKNEAAKIFHHIWWEQWKTRESKMREAGKGVNIEKQMNTEQKPAKNE